jgi:hypothetical protein
MYIKKGKEVYNHNKLIKKFDSEEDAEGFFNAINYLDKLEKFNEKYNPKNFKMITTINEWKKMNEIVDRNSKNNSIFDKSNVNNIFEKSLEDKLFIGDFDLFSEDEEIIEENNKKYEVYIDYLNKDKNFKLDRISFKTYDEAVQWMTKNLEKFNTDMINYY